MIKVAYDYQAFEIQSYGGVSRYCCELAQGVPHHWDFETRVIAPVHFNRYLWQSKAAVSGVYRQRNRRIYRAINRLAAGVMMRAFNPDIVHRTYYAATPAPSGATVVVTVHDMIHELFADHFQRDDPTTRLKRASVEAADLVLCNSRHTANDLMRLFGVPVGKIRVTHLAAGDALTRANAPPAPSPHGREYLLYVGQRRGYKNFEGAMRAYAQSPRLCEGFDWVLFGGAEIDNVERALFASLGLRADAVHRLTGDDDCLASAYAGAHAFIYPSKYEGFGIPPLEAMAQGCPVACSSVSSIPEVVGDAAQLFDPTDMESMRQAMETVCFDMARREWLIAQGRQRAKGFSWDRCARETAQAYREVLGMASRPGLRTST
jgi:glycosyltransferase involved in cell wall biosynthesis